MSWPPPAAPSTPDRGVLAARRKVAGIRGQHQHQDRDRNTQTHSSTFRSRSVALAARASAGALGGTTCDLTRWAGPRYHTDDGSHRG